MSLAHLLAIVRARWISVALVMTALMVFVTARTLLQPPQYTASASVLVDVQSPDPVAGITLQGLGSPSYMLTQVDVIKSLRVAARVANSLNLIEDPAWHRRWLEATSGRGSKEAWVADKLRSGLDARPSRGSNVINVSYTAPDAPFAALVANAFVQAYVDTTLELRVEPARQYNKFFEAHAKQLRVDLEAAKAKLSSYQRSSGIIATDERMDIENARLAELSSQLVDLQQIAYESGSRQGQVANNADHMQEVLSNSVISSLTADLSRQEARLNELNSRLGDEHPQVKELQANIAQVRNRIQVETRRVTASVRVNNNVTQSRLAELTSALERQRAKVLEMKTRRDGADVLERDVENAQRAYEAVLSRVSQTSMEGETKQSNVSRLELATEPTEPSAPRIRINLALGFVFSLAAGLVTAALREYRDRRLRLTSDIPVLVDFPVVGVIPAFGKQRGLSALSFGGLPFRSKHHPT